MFLLEIVASSYIMMWVERLSYIFLWERNLSAVSVKIPSDFAVCVPMLVRMDVHSLSMQFIRAMGLSIVGGVMGVGFVGFVDEFGGAGA